MLERFETYLHPNSKPVLGPVCEFEYGETRKIWPSPLNLSLYSALKVMYSQIFPFLLSQF